MATRWYTDPTNAPAVSPAYDAGWDETAAAARRKLCLAGPGGGFSSSNFNPRTLALGSGTWTIAGSGTSWSTSSATALTVTGTGTINMTSASTKTITTGNIDYTGVTLNQGGAGQLNITGNSSFANITKTYVGTTTLSFSTTTQRVANFTATGTAGNVLTIKGSSATSPCTLIHTGAGDIGIDYVTITGVKAYQI